MFYPENIRGIKKGDRVLEIGPGGSPFSRADVFLDLDPSLFKDDIVAGYQRGNAAKLTTDKPIIYYDGKKFPFKRNEFDYVICSHVLEHVEDPAFFLKEIARVAAKGYIEFPTIFYEYLYDIPVHLNFCYYDGSKVLYLRKTDTSFSEFAIAQKFFLSALEAGYTDIVDDLKPYMAQGFEWRGKITVRKAKRFDDLVSARKLKLKPKIAQKTIEDYNGRALVGHLINRLHKKIKHTLRIT